VCLAIVAAAAVIAGLSGAEARTHGSRHGRNRHHDATSAAKKVEAPAPQGPLVINVSIDRQKLTIYDANGVFAQSPVSTGRSGHGTPLGVFSVIEKQVFHRSNLYHSAPMPHMQRLTWSGVAMHAGSLPGYPASHGCIRMPAAFATSMYRWTTLGARVIVTADEVAPSAFSHPFLASRELMLRPAVSSDPPPGPPPTIAPVETAPSDVPLQAQPVPELRSTLGYQEAIADVLLTHDDAIPVIGLATSAEQDAAINPESPASFDPEAVSSLATPTHDATAPATAATQAGKPEPGRQETRKETKQESKPDSRIAVFISGSQARVYVRENFAALFDAPVTIAPADRPLGTHVFTAVSDPKDAATLRWSVVSMPLPPPPARDGRAGRRHRHRQAAATVSEKPRPAPDSASEALDRITIPVDTMTRITGLLVPGSSIIVSDQGVDPDKTGKGRDFTVRQR